MPAAVDGRSPGEFDPQRGGMAVVRQPGSGTWEKQTLRVDFSWTGPWGKTGENVNVFRVSKRCGPASPEVATPRPAQGSCQAKTLRLRMGREGRPCPPESVLPKVVAGNVRTHVPPDPGRMASAPPMTFTCTFRFPAARGGAGLPRRAEALHHPALAPIPKAVGKCPLRGPTGAIGGEGGRMAGGPALGSGCGMEVEGRPLPQRPAADAASRAAQAAA